MAELSVAYIGVTTVASAFSSHISVIWGGDVVKSRHCEMPWSLLAWLPVRLVGICEHRHRSMNEVAEPVVRVRP